MAPQLLTTSNFIGPWYHAALLFSWARAHCFVVWCIVFSANQRRPCKSCNIAPILTTPFCYTPRISKTKRISYNYHIFYPCSLSVVEFQLLKGCKLLRMCCTSSVSVKIRYPFLYLALASLRADVSYFLQSLISGFCDPFMY